MKRETWWNKRKAHAEAPPPITATQEHNNQPPEPQASIAQSDESNLPPVTLLEQATRPHRLHAERADAFQAMGLPDIAPPIPKPSRTLKSRQALADRLDALNDDQAVMRAQIQADMQMDAYAASLNQAGEINGALAPQRSYAGKCEDHDDDEYIRLLEIGYLPIEIARSFSIEPTRLIRYLREPQRLARALDARESAGHAYDAKALQVIRTAAPGQEAKARAIAAHLQWRASKLAPQYQDKQRLTVDGGLTITHEAPDRPAIVDMVSEALREVTPKPRVIDVDEC